MCRLCSLTVITFAYRLIVCCVTERNCRDGNTSRIAVRMCVDGLTLCASATESGLPVSMPVRKQLSDLHTQRQVIYTFFSNNDITTWARKDLEHLRRLPSCTSVSLLLYRCFLTIHLPRNPTNNAVLFCPTQKEREREDGQREGV